MIFAIMMAIAAMTFAGLMLFGVIVYLFDDIPERVLELISLGLIIVVGFATFCEVYIQEARS